MREPRHERGQSLVIMAVGIVVMLLLVALIIDGGSIYLNRRRAQTAADAGAMAGAHKLCVDHGSLAEVQAAALEYAVTENGATAMESAEIDADSQVMVRTRVDSPSFFAALFGYDTDSARAVASAGCFPPSSPTRMLPIAWTCRPPVGGSNEECKIKTIPLDVFTVLLSYFDFEGIDGGLLDEGDGANHATYTDGVGGKLTYLVMDSDSFDPTVDCVELNPFGAITCDFDGDGILDVEGGADRGWLQLDGTGASDLSTIIRYGFPGEIDLPHWLPGKTGVANSVYDAADDIQGDLATVPVFNAICEDTTVAGLPTACPTEYEAGDRITASSGNHTFYRVVGVAPFVVTCVSKVAGARCPGKTHAGLVGPSLSNISTIEGYFVDGLPVSDDIDPGGFDLGIYVISLTR